MATVSWEAPGSWTDAFATANFTSLASGSGVLSTSTAVANGTNKELYLDLSFISASTTFLPTAGGHLAFFLLPLLHDGATYPTASTSATASAQAQATYCIGTMAFGAATAAHCGALRGVIILPGTFKFYCINRTGVALPAGTTQTCQYRLYSEVVA